MLVWSEYLRLRYVLTLIFSVLILTLGVGPVAADSAAPEITELLPAKIGDFRQLNQIRPSQSLIGEGVLIPEMAKASDPANSGLVNGEVQYRAGNGKRLLVEVVQFRKDSDAYSLLTIVARQRRDSGAGIVLDGQVGTASATFANGIVFFKGTTFVRVSNAAANAVGSSEAVELARLIAEKLDKGEGEIPVLIQHLPEWQNAQHQVLYFSGFKSLQAIAPDQPVLSVLDSAGDAEAVVAEYGPIKLLLVEFNTPQLAGDNDRQITSKLQELRKQNQPVPASYRRVGNYSVFVFNAPSEQVSNELINRIQYEQVVQWLGENPYWLKEAQRRYTETTLGVLVAVVKASGLTLVVCFGLGGLIGGLLFARRRAHQATNEAFSDAGGMLRLNLDEMTPQTDPSRLLADRN
jgi:hypothetical protein